MLSCPKPMGSRCLASLFTCLVLGCGASPPAGPACEVVDPCGGDLAGTWEIDSGCLTLKSPFTQPECRAVERGAEYLPSGTVTYVTSIADPRSGTMTPSYSFRFTASEVYSPACLSALGFHPGSTEACDGLQALWSGPFVVSCAPSQGGCECDFADEQNATAAEDYTVAEGRLVFSPTDSVEFCRSGTTLVESAVTDSSISRVRLHLRDP